MILKVLYLDGKSLKTLRIFTRRTHRERSSSQSSDFGVPPPLSWYKILETNILSDCDTLYPLEKWERRALVSVELAS